MGSRWLQLGCLLLACAVASPVRADEKEAERLYLKGLDLYQQRRYDEAIAAYLGGYSASRRPGFLYNIALAYGKKGDCRAASEYYQRYLEREPQSPLRKRVEGELARLRACRAEAPSPPRASPPPAAAEAAPRPPLLPSPEPPVAEPRRGRWGALITGGAGLALLIAGAALAASARSDYDWFERECAPACPPERWASPRTRERVGVGLLVGGGVAVAAGLTWWLLTGRRPAAGAGARGAAVALGARF